MVSAMAISSGSPAASRSASARTRVDRHFTFERTAERRRDGDLRANARRRAPAAAMSSQASMPSSTLQPWLRWLKRFAGGDRHADLGAAGGARALEALAVQHQADVTRAGRSRRRAPPAPLRRPPSAARAWDSRSSPLRCASSPRARRRRTNSTFARGGEHLRFALQAVTRPDFDDLDARMIPWREFYARSSLACLTPPAAAGTTRTAMTTRTPSTRRARRSSRARTRHADRRTVLRAVARRHGC